jgi:hypothetical protein
VVDLAGVVTVGERQRLRAVPLDLNDRDRPVGQHAMDARAGSDVLETDRNRRSQLAQICEVTDLPAASTCRIRPPHGHILAYRPPSRSTRKAAGRCVTIIAADSSAGRNSMIAVPDNDATHLHESADEFIARKNSQFESSLLVRAKDIGRRGRNVYEREAWTFWPLKSSPHKVLLIERLRRIAFEGEARSSLSGVSFDHRLWHNVKLNYESLEANAPEGYVPQVEVYVGGDPMPIPIGVVEAHRTKGWVLLHSLTEGRNDPNKMYATDRYVFVEDREIARVDIRFVREGKFPIGFHVREASEEEPPGDGL